MMFKELWGTKPFLTKDGFLPQGSKKAKKDRCFRVETQFTKPQKEAYRINK